MPNESFEEWLDDLIKKEELEIPVMRLLKKFSEEQRGAAAAGVPPSVLLDPSLDFESLGWGEDF